MAGLRLEAEKPKQVTVAELPTDQQVEHWKRIATQSAARLTSQTSTIQDMKKTANDLRENLFQMGKRLDYAQEQIDTQQARIVALENENSDLKSQLQPIEVLKRKVWEALYA